ncbi:MAG: type IV pilus twitching motility protein PilT [Bdellovibrionota bacterium]
MVTGLGYSFPQLLKALIDQNGSDLHITSGSPPRLRLSGSLLKLELPPLTPSQTQTLCYSVLTEEQKRKFETDHELDFSFNITGLARFRANIYMQRGTISGAFRVIPLTIKTLKELQMAPIITDLCQLPRGLILVTGPTGSGKSTTMAAMLDYINANTTGHIVTIEDPIEFIHQHKNCIVNQREIGSDSRAFQTALRSALRQDPDVIMVGELRDLETISMALTAAETGHLVIGTLHTNSAVSTLTRIVDVFPSNQQSQIRTQLSFTLKAVLSQILVPMRQDGRAMAMEIMVLNQAIENMIREDKLHNVYSAIQTGQATTGMQTMNQSLFDLARHGKISKEIALSKSSDVDELEQMFYKNSMSQGRGKPGRIA